jgi:hypothetical protein
VSGIFISNPGSGGPVAEDRNGFRSTHRMTRSSSVAPMRDGLRSGGSRSGVLRLFIFLFPGVEKDGIAK